MEYILGVSLSYVVMGLMAGVMLHLIGRILHPARPQFILGCVLVGQHQRHHSGLGPPDHHLPHPSCGFHTADNGQIREPIWVDAAWALFVITILFVGHRA